MMRPDEQACFARQYDLVIEDDVVGRVRIVRANQYHGSPTRRAWDVRSIEDDVPVYSGHAYDDELTRTDELIP